MNIVSHMAIVDATITPLEVLAATSPKMCTPALAAHNEARNCWAMQNARTGVDRGPCFHLIEELTLVGDERALQASVGNLLAIRTERI